MNTLARLGGGRGLLGLALILLVLGVVALGPVLSPYDPDQPDFAATLAPPSAVHPFGTDDLGRDVLARILRGGRVSLLVAVGGVGGAGLLGVPLGLACGFLGGWLDRAAMRGVDVLLAFPGILLALGITAALGASAATVALAVALVNLPVFARIARAQAIGLRHLDFVTAARAVGRTEGGILWRTVAPNALSPILVQGTVLLAAAILTESYLSFLAWACSRPRRAGATCCGTRRASWTRRNGWHGSQGWPCSPSCSASTCWGTGCATAWIPALPTCEGGPRCPV